MAIVVGTTYEVIPENETPDPDFTYQSEDKDELLYAMLFMGAFSGLYLQYKDKGTDYAIENIEKDTKSLLKTLTPETEQLKTVFKEASDKVLLDASILKSNLEKAKLKLNVTNGVLEQKQTLKSITNELSTNIKAKAYYLKNRGSEELFNVKSNFNRAAKRTKDMVESGYETSKQKGKRAAQIFLYNDPPAYWITKRDGRVCKYCIRLEFESPLPLSKLPYTPLHKKCRCKVELEDEIDMTADAITLTRYDLDLYT